MKSRGAVLASALLLLGQGVLSKPNSSRPGFNNSVGNENDDSILALPGFMDSVPYGFYSGYLNADLVEDKFHHYWFVGSNNDRTKDPIVVWFSGGPACSSLGGFFTEVGPLQVGDDGKALSLREFSWNKKANILVIEGPVGVGQSYSVNEHLYADDETTAADNYQALKSFFEKFSELKGNPLFLAGESYAGGLLPALGVLLDSDPEINLKGLAIGNGLLETEKSVRSLPFFLFYHGLTDKKAWNDFEQDCCKGKTPTMEGCDTASSGGKCKDAIAALHKNIDKLNPYNIYNDCISFEPTSNSSSIESNGSPSADIGCLRTKPVTSYLNEPWVRDFTHVLMKSGLWDFCSSKLNYKVKYPDLKGGLSPQFKRLIASKRKLKLVIYNGDVSLMSNFLGNEWFADELGLKVLKDYSTWYVGKQIGGFVKHYEGFSFVLVRGAGHLTAQDRPEATYKMIDHFLSSSDDFNL